jgi:hypothetical protein
MSLICDTGVLFVPELVMAELDCWCHKRLTGAETCSAPTPTSVSGWLTQA